MTEAHDTIDKAIENETPVSFFYQPSDMSVAEAEAADLARRFVSPYSVDESSTGKDLLTCFDHGKEGIRRYDVARIFGVRSEEGREDFVHPVERD